jgi:MFS family permease
VRLLVLSISFGGYLADVFSRKKLVYGLQMAMAFNGIIYIFAPSWEWLLLARSIDSIISGLRSPAFSALLAEFGDDVLQPTGQ